MEYSIIALLILTTGFLAYKLQAVIKASAENEKRALRDFFEAEKRAELAEQRVEEMEARMQDWEKTRQESMQAAKAAMFESGSEVFRKEAEQMGKQTLEHFQKVIASVSSLQERLHRNETMVGTVWQALATPAAAGSFAEIGLENTLKQYGLEEGRDFITQFSVSNNKLRPDAVIFLPGGNILVVDSKASKFFLELAAQGEEKTTLENLRATMQEHLRILASKGYKEAVAEAVKKNGHNDIRHIFTVMFVQTEGFIDKICQADSTFRRRCEEADIVLSGPTGIGTILSLVRYEIAKSRQEDNQQHILEEISKLLGSIEIVLEHTEGFGKSLKSLFGNYDKLARSVNGNLLPKARKVQQMGVALPKGKKLPQSLPIYYVSADATPVIEGEASEETPAALVEA